MGEGFALHEIICDEQGRPCDYRFLDINPAFERLTGWESRQVLGRTIREVLPTIEPFWIETYGKVALTGQPGKFEQFSKPLGRYYGVTAYSPRKGQFAVLFSDLTEAKQEQQRLQKLNRTLKALSDSNQAMMRATEERAYLQEVCRIIVQDCGHMMVWIGYAEEDEEKEVRPVAYAGFEEGYLETLQVTWADSERGRGPTGTAIRTGQPNVCNNMLAEARFAPWRDQAIQRGYASSIAIPLLTGGKAFGALTIYSQEPHPFSEDEIKLLTELGGDLATGITSLRLKRAQQEAEQTLEKANEQLEQRVAERTAELGEKTRFLEAFFHHSLDSLVFLDKAFNFIRVNESYAKACQREVGEFPGHNHFEFYPNPENEEIFRQVVRTRTPHLARAKPFVFADHPEWGVTYWDWTLVPVLDGEGEVDFLVFSLRDVTPQKKAEAELAKYSEQLEELVRQRTVDLEATNAKLQLEIGERQKAEQTLRQVAEELARSNRELEQFAYVASHDLQEPLRAVAGYVGLLHRRFPELLDAKAQHYIEGAKDGAVRMQRLIEDLLSLSRVQTKGKRFAPADLNAALEHALSNLQASLQESQARVTVDPLPTLRVDASQITQLLQNLIGNALKFRRDAPPQIHVSAQCRDQEWVFSVQDNGIGIEPQYFERIFQIFQRLHTRRHYPGTGIGLAICKRIAERHGGTIWVESQLEQGSTFFFSIPERTQATA